MDKLDFSKLDFNLYQVLNLTPDFEHSKLKKNYQKLVLKYHPDKGPKGDNRLFEIINYSYQILKNPETKNAYDEYLSQDSNDFFILKSVDKIKKETRKEINDINKKNWKESNEELNKFHQFDENLLNPLDKKNLQENLNKVKNYRESDEFKIDKGNVNDTNFHHQFKENITKPKNNQIIKSVAQKDQLVCYNEVNSNYASLDDYGKLYLDDDESFNTTSMRDAFILTDLANQKVEEKEVASEFDRMKKETEFYHNITDRSFFQNSSYWSSN